MSTTPVSPSYYADFRGLDSLKKAAREHDPKALKQVARQFESLLTGMLLKSMRAAKLGDGLGDSQETEFYQDMLDQQVAVQLSQGKGLGLADMLVQQLARSGLAGPATRTPPSAPAAPIPVAATPRAQGAAGIAIASPAVAPATTVVTKAQAPSVPVAEQAAFIRKIGPYADRAAERLGITPDALIAHAALETGWGRHVPSGADGNSSFNLFGIKAGTRWNGATASCRTLEYDGGVPASVTQPFRSYASLEQGIDDYVSVLQNSPRFRAVLGTGRDTGAFAQGLARGGYATDPEYGSKLAAVADRVRALRVGAAAEPLKFAAALPTMINGNTADTRRAT